MYWRKVPPAALQLRRIAQFLGLPDPAPATYENTSPDAAFAEAQQAGMSVLNGEKPNDPYLQLLEGLDTWQPTRTKS